jgi:hypothetical protein
MAAAVEIVAPVVGIALQAIPILTQIIWCAIFSILILAWVLKGAKLISIQQSDLQRLKK